MSYTCFFIPPENYIVWRETVNLPNYKDVWIPWPKGLPLNIEQEQDGEKATAVLSDHENALILNATGKSIFGRLLGTMEVSIMSRKLQTYISKDNQEAYMYNSICYMFKYCSDRGYILVSY